MTENIKNMSDQPINLVMIAGLYDGSEQNILKTVHQSEICCIQPNAQEEINLSFPIEGISESTVMKVFVLENSSKMPYRSMQTFYKTEI